MNHRLVSIALLCRTSDQGINNTPFEENPQIWRSLFHSVIYGLECRMRIAGPESMLISISDEYMKSTFHPATCRSPDSPSGFVTSLTLTHMTGVSSEPACGCHQTELPTHANDVHNPVHRGCWERDASRRRNRWQTGIYLRFARHLEFP